MINFPPTSKLEMYVLQSQILIEIEHENQEQSDHIIGLKGYNHLALQPVFISSI